LSALLCYGIGFAVEAIEVREAVIEEMVKTKQADARTARARYAGVVETLELRAEVGETFVEVPRHFPERHPQSASGSFFWIVVLGEALCLVGAALHLSFPRNERVASVG
jgi:hypothetical protein